MNSTSRIQLSVMFSAPELFRRYFTKLSVFHKFRPKVCLFCQRKALTLNGNCFSTLHIWKRNSTCYNKELVDPFQKGSPRKQMLRTLSVDIGNDAAPASMPTQQSSLPVGNGPVSSPSSSPLLGNHIGPLAEKETSLLQKTGTSGPSQMLVLQEALKHGLASTRQQLRKTSETLDGIRW